MRNKFEKRKTKAYKSKEIVTNLTNLQNILWLTQN